MGIIRFFTKADTLLDVAMRWGAFLASIWAFFSWLAKQMTWLGDLNWPEAIFIGFGVALLAALVVSASLVSVRFFRPLPVLPTTQASGVRNTPDPQSIYLEREALVPLRSMAENAAETSGKANALARRAFEATGKFPDVVHRTQLMADAVERLALLERLEGLEDDIAAQCSSLEGEWAKGAEIAKQEGVAPHSFSGAWTGYTTGLPSQLKRLSATLSERAGIAIDVESAAGYINDPAANVPGDEAITSEQTKHTYRRLYHRVKEATQEAGKAAGQIEQMRREARKEIAEALEAVRRPL